MREKKFQGKENKEPEQRPCNSCEKTAFLGMGRHVQKIAEESTEFTYYSNSLIFK